MSLGSTFISEMELALPLVTAPEKLIDFVSTPGMDDTDGGRHDRSRTRHS